MMQKTDSALVVVGHGSTLNPDSADPTYDHVETLRDRGCFAEVIPCFWKEEPGMREVLHMVSSKEIYVVPNFISEGYFTLKVIPRELGLEGPITRRGERVIKYCAPVGSHPGMTEVLLQRSQEVAPGVDPAEVTLFIVGHGTQQNDQSALAAKHQVALLKEQGKFGDVQAAYMEEAPLITDWAEMAPTPVAVVVPFFISDGLHSYQDIPVMLDIEKEPTAAASERSLFRNNPYHLKGKTLYYASAIGTEPLMADVILDQVRAFDLEHPESAERTVSLEKA